MCKIVLQDVVFYESMASEHRNYALVKPQCSTSLFFAVLFCLYEQKDIIKH
jgi:hypothetical protein